ncbi:MAG: hypothetical protein POH28_14190 [Acidocella sp.]|nr:hypothetical protein [Acidocella sp.]
MAKSRAKPRTLLRPGLLTLALALGWAAQHEPPAFTIGSVGVWVLGMVTTFILVRATLAFLGPLLAVCGALVERARQNQNAEAEP